MNLLFTQSEQKVINQIEEKFGDDYKLDYGIEGISIFINSKLFSSKLNIDVHSTLSDQSLLLSIDDGKKHVMKIDNDEPDHLYLEVLQDIMNNLNNQLDIYSEFISGFAESITDEYMWDALLDLVSCKLYVKGKRGKAVVEPVFDITNDEDYATMHINSIDGNYPMKKFTSISYDDLKDDISFFVD